MLHFPYHAQHAGSARLLPQSQRCFVVRPYAQAMRVPAIAPPTILPMNRAVSAAYPGMWPIRWSAMKPATKAPATAPMEIKRFIRVWASS